MGLSCSCSDFDPSEHDSWFEPGRRSVPPAGTRCCECAATLPAGEKCATILNGEAYEPDEATLAADPEPDEDDYPDEDGPSFDDILDAWRDRHGWCSDQDRFVHYTHEYRCERCSGLAEAIEDMGYCMIGPGDLIDCHTEYVNEVQELADGVERHEIIWERRGDGVWHPRRKTDRDRRREAVRRRWRGLVSWLRYGWKLDLKYKVWHRVMRAAGYQFQHDYKTRKYYWARKPRAVPPWERGLRREKQ